MEMMNHCSNVEEPYKVYFIEAIFNKHKRIKLQPVKIGFSRDVDSRLRHLQCANFNKLTLKLSIPVDDVVVARKREKFFHKQLHYARIRGEWFNLHGRNIKSLAEKFYSSHAKWLNDHLEQKGESNIFDSIREYRKKKKY